MIGFRKYYGENYKEFKRKFHNYPKIEITTVSQKLSQDIKRIVSKMGFSYNLYAHYPKKEKESVSYKITINGVPMIKKWMQEIGTKNYTKLSRYLIWERFGFCPTNLTLSQRKDILKDKLDPSSVGL